RSHRDEPELASATIANRVDQLALPHPAATLDLQVARNVAQLIDRTILVAAIRVARALRGAARRAAFLAPVPVHGTCGDLLRPLGRGTALTCAVLDMLVLAFVPGAPALRHGSPPLMRSCTWRAPDVQNACDTSLHGRRPGLRAGRIRAAARARSGCCRPAHRPAQSCCGPQPVPRSCSRPTALAPARSRLHPARASTSACPPVR